MPAAPKRSKNADWGFTTAASSPIADTQVSAKRSSPDASSGNPQSHSGGRVRIDPDAQRASRGKRLVRRAPNVTGSTCRVVGQRPVHTVTGIRPARSLFGQVGIPNRVAKGRELRGRPARAPAQPVPASGQPDRRTPPSRPDTADAPAG